MPRTAEQHCFVHPGVAYTLYEGLVEARWVRLGVPVGFQHPISSSLVLWGLLLRRIKVRQVS